MFLSANNAAVATVAADSVSTINFGCEIYTCNNSNSNNCNLSDPQKQRHSLAASLLTSPSATTNNDRLLFSELSRNNLIYTSPIATSTRSTTLCSCVYYYNSTFGGTKMLKYPRTSSSNSSGFFEDDDLMEIYQTPPQSPISSPNLLLSSPSPPVASYGTSNVAHCLQRHIVRMFSANECVKRFPGINTAQP
ncbi:hypothetical protein GQX74_010233 [Glossina fuscipes]|nr:hypothetical protein GQX74_010233 [Glossina fuscipes]